MFPDTICYKNPCSNPGFKAKKNLTIKIWEIRLIRNSYSLSKLNTQICGHHCNSFLLMRTDKITKDQSTSPLMKKMVQFRRIDSVLTFEEFKYMPKNKELHNNFCSIV